MRGQQWLSQDWFRLELSGLSWSGKGHYRFFGICNGRRADHHRLPRICRSVEEIAVGSSPVYGGRAKIIAGSVGICNGREIIAGSGICSISLISNGLFVLMLFEHLEDLLWSSKGYCRFGTYL